MSKTTALITDAFPKESPRRMVATPPPNVPVRGRSEQRELRSAPLGSSTPLLRSASLNDLRSPQENGLRDRQAERFSGLHVDDQIELCGPLHGQVARLRTFQDPVDEVGGPA